MSNEEIRELLKKLHAEIQKTEVDADTRSLMKNLDSDIHELLDSAPPGSDASQVLERARLLETQFASSHPAAERFLREVIDTLVRIGI